MFRVDPELDASVELADDVSWRNFASTVDVDGRLPAEERIRRAEAARHAFLCRMVLRRAEIRAADARLKELIAQYRREVTAARNGEPVPCPRPKPKLRTPSGRAGWQALPLSN